ncbi:Proteasome subunit beta type-4 [Coemansia thaxteri]|uniref:Proteasome subunit beta n=1 Tax=Coemansia thaxteri TaxID=2663907 RepID=A0A9W8EFC4_9FUNG|nr:Proteasome subunit beta type-4 [Coemansia thaxteri]KAJ2007215.1 Proteasome subunit beta type-4 [Coemansia thaxteri]KAJ2470154.1 Proteasome subunit beta type-4 [Coemansia sp. RSA 2322]KAJ2481011.1 Proteasome subunit beta type-4 [Coemansia sp. RSA 2320]
MDAQFAISGRDFVISVTDKGVARSIVKMKHNEDKTWQLSSHTLMSVSGEAGDTANFSEYIQGNVRLYSMRNSQDLSPSELANFIRGELAAALRSRSPSQVNLLVAGYDKGKDEAALYWIDYLSAMAKVPFAAHGYCGYFLYSVMDREYTPEITLEEAKALIKKCFEVLKTRFIVDFANYTIKVVDRNGTHEIRQDEL